VTNVRQKSIMSACWSVTDNKFEALLDVIREHYPRQIENVLVVGCGTGREAILMSQRMGCNVEGIDITGHFFETPPDSRVRLRVMDICKTDYESNKFDFLYSYHVFEHIPDLAAALQEMGRLLRPGGIFCIGTPNKSRIIGSVGTREPLAVKIMSNINDWKMRLTNRWENSLGAHAGFTRKSLQQICSDAFGKCIDITDEYYLRVYSSRARMIETIIKLRLGNRIFPGVYMLGARSESSSRP